MSTATQREEALFDAARNLPGREAREAFLDLHCGKEPALRQRIEALLATEREADRFFTECRETLNLPEGPAPFTWDTASSTERLRTSPPGEEQIGARIGRYKILSKIGEGGCGVVYLAEQEQPVRRLVALKIIKLGMETKSVIARFEAERQALAMMDHPNIAMVFDAGATHRGPPYFVMELVRGERITAYCDHHQLSVSQRLDLFIQICHAIQHAHQKGIIHGDIKPSNIMVTQHDGAPMPKVIDFGISKATETRFEDIIQATPNHQVIGTPAYMSPEQAEMSGMDVDTRSDIYCLGVLLYELLTGRTPFYPEELLASGLDEMRRTLRETIPSLPSTRLRELGEADASKTASARGTTARRLISCIQGDLDAIVMKALKKDRRHRYETSNALAMDIQRHLCNEPVIAHRSSRLYRFQKLVRRNRIVFAASGAVAVALIAGMSSSTWLFIKEREAHHRALAAELEQTHLRRQAETREKITYATLLVSQSKYEEADRVLGEVSLNQPTLEGAATLRSVGERLAIEGRWKPASERFLQLLKVNQLDGLDMTTLDHLRCGPALIEAGNFSAYNTFCEEAIARCLERPSPFSDRILKISLLGPTNGKRLNALLSFAKLSEKTFRDADAANDSFKAAWNTVSLGLWEYRNGNYNTSIDWCRRGLAYQEHNEARTATTLMIRAMAHYQLGQIEQAREALESGRELIESRFKGSIDMGNPVQGFWFDWVFARILMNEVKGLMRSSAPSKSG